MANCINYEYDTNLIYKGEHDLTKASDGEGYWTITKYTYSGDDVVKEQTIYGERINWTDRANYF